MILLFTSYISCLALFDDHILSVPMNALYHYGQQTSNATSDVESHDHWEVLADTNHPDHPSDLDMCPPTGMLGHLRQTTSKMLSPFKKRKGRFRIHLD